MPRSIDIRARLVGLALPEDEWFSPSRLAELLGINRETVHRMVYRNELPPMAKRTKHRSAFRRADLVAFQRQAAES
jgi:predicted DNA-binding transcriptional regulator AlpA